MPEGRFPDPNEEDIMAGDRRISRPDASLPDWEVPDSSYRPIPIVWFTGAMIAQMLSNCAVFVMFLPLHGVFTITLAALLTGLIAAWTWNRGMHSANPGWRIATVTMFSVQLLAVGLAVVDRL